MSSPSSGAKENVRVVVRAKPILAGVVAGAQDSSATTTTTTMMSSNSSEPNFRFDMEKATISRLGEKVQGQNELRHTFDAVFDDDAIVTCDPSETRQKNKQVSMTEKQTIFFDRHVRPLIDRALAQGINLSILSYGATGSGKTHTIDGKNHPSMRTTGTATTTATTISENRNTENSNYNDASECDDDGEQRHGTSEEESRIRPQKKDRGRESDAQQGDTDEEEEVEGIVSLAMRRCVSILEPKAATASTAISTAATSGSNSNSTWNGNNINNNNNNNIVWMRLAVKFVEIYNEKLVDLLAAAVAPKRSEDSDKLLRLRLRRREDGEDVFFVENLLCFECDSVADAMQWYRRGAQQKTFRAHKINAHSSRSHCIFTMVVTICFRNADDDDNASGGGVSLNRRTFEMNFVDLAGSERPDRIAVDESKVDMRQKAKAQQHQQALFSESLHINGSLSTLGRVITALAKGSHHVPFRESKLTSLLRHALGSNGLLLFIACVSANNVAETTRTLQFASQARTIRVVASPVQDASTILIAQLRARIRDLEGDLAAALAINNSNNNNNNNNNSNNGNNMNCYNENFSHDASANMKENRQLISSTTNEFVPDDGDDGEESTDAGARTRRSKQPTGTIVVDGIDDGDNKTKSMLLLQRQRDYDDDQLQQQQHRKQLANGNDNNINISNNNREALLSQSLYIACTKMQSLLRSNGSLRSQIDGMRNEQENVSERLSELERENLNLREKLDILSSVVTADAKSTENLLRAALHGNHNLHSHRAVASERSKSNNNNNNINISSRTSSRKKMKTTASTASSSFSSNKNIATIVSQPSPPSLIPASIPSARTQLSLLQQQLPPLGPNNNNFQRRPSASSNSNPTPRTSSFSSSSSHSANTNTVTCNASSSYAAGASPQNVVGLPLSLFGGAK